MSTGIVIVWECRACDRQCQVEVKGDTNKPIRCPFEAKPDGDSAAKWRVA